MHLTLRKIAPHNKETSGIKCQQHQGGETLPQISSFKKANHWQCHTFREPTTSLQNKAHEGKVFLQTTLQLLKTALSRNKPGCLTSVYTSMMHKFRI